MFVCYVCVHADTCVCANEAIESTLFSLYNLIFISLLIQYVPFVLQNIQTDRLACIISLLRLLYLLYSTSTFTLFTLYNGGHSFLINVSDNPKQNNKCLYFLMPCLLLIKIPFCIFLLSGMRKYASGLFDFILTAGYSGGIIPLINGGKHHLFH